MLPYQTMRAGDNGRQLALTRQAARSPKARPHLDVSAFSTAACYRPAEADGRCEARFGGPAQRPSTSDGRRTESTPVAGETS